MRSSTPATLLVVILISHVQIIAMTEVPVIVMPIILWYKSCINWDSQ